MQQFCENKRQKGYYLLVLNICWMNQAVWNASIINEKYEMLKAMFCTIQV